MAILTDLSIEKDITKEIKDAKNWDALNKKYYGKTIKTLNRRISHHLTRSRKSDFHFSQAIKKIIANKKNSLLKIE